MEGHPSQRAPRSVFALRLGEVERRILEAAARRRGVTLGEFLRSAAAEVARVELPASAIASASRSSK